MLSTRTSSNRTSDKAAHYDTLSHTYYKTKQNKNKKQKNCQAVVANTFNPSAQEAEAGGSVTLRPARATQERNCRAAEVRGQAPEARPRAWNQVRYKTMAASVVEYNQER